MRRSRHAPESAAFRAVRSPAPAGRLGDGDTCLPIRSDPACLALRVPGSSLVLRKQPEERRERQGASGSTVWRKFLGRAAHRVECGGVRHNAVRFGARHHVGHTSVMPEGWHRARRWLNTPPVAQQCGSARTDVDGGRSSVGRAPDCDSGRRGFESHRPPHLCATRTSLVLDGRAASSMVEQLTLNQLVRGSSPRRPTIFPSDCRSAAALRLNACRLIPSPGCIGSRSHAWKRWISMATV